MHRTYNTIFFIFLSLLTACSVEKQSATDLKLDHLNIWVQEPNEAKKLLTDIGFKAVPDSLSKIHYGQGTAGRYFYFLNTYLELIFVHNEDELIENNELNKDLDFIERANCHKNGASPFSVALKVADYEVDKIPFEKISYHQDWMEADVAIYAAKNSKKQLKEPSLFVVYPEIEADVFNSFSDLKQIPEEYALWRSFFKHPNGAKKLTDVIITSTDLDMKTKSIEALNGLDNLSVQNGSTHLMELYFDEHAQGKIFDLRPELPLIIYL